MTEGEIERERCVDDDYNVINHYYRAKYWHPNIPFFLQDEKGESYYGTNKLYRFDVSIYFSLFLEDSTVILNVGRDPEGAPIGTRCQG